MIELCVFRELMHERQALKRMKYRLVILDKFIIIMGGMDGIEARFYEASMCRDMHWNAGTLARAYEELKRLNHV